jgi:DNA-binding CsgD family transcriptional regulator
LKKKIATPLSNKHEVLKEAIVTLRKEVPETVINRLIKEDGLADSQPFFPAGSACTYIFSYASFSIIAIDDNAAKVLGMPPKKILNRPMIDVFSGIIADEHVYAAVRFSKIAYEVTSMEKDVTICFDFFIRMREQERRLMQQYRVVSYTALQEPLLAKGYFTDITHLVKNGPPRLFVVKNNLLQQLHTATPEELLAGNEIPLTTKELMLLQLKNKGLRAKEIADSMHMKELSIYSMIRDIKQKTGKDTLPLIHLLEEKGLL